jgi:hypothetical protein
MNLKGLWGYGGDVGTVFLAHRATSVGSLRGLSNQCRRIRPGGVAVASMTGSDDW